MLSGRSVWVVALTSTGDALAVPPANITSPAANSAAFFVIDHMLTSSRALLRFVIYRYLTKWT